MFGNPVQHHHWNNVAERLDDARASS